MTAFDPDDVPVYLSLEFLPWLQCTGSVDALACDLKGPAEAVDSLHTHARDQSTPASHVSLFALAA